ncbi:hypothetical protein ACFQ0M_32355 [Kitasatospora aburaviensis]
MPALPTAAGLSPERRRGALLATDLQDIPFWRRATPRCSRSSWSAWPTCSPARTATSRR